MKRVLVDANVFLYALGSEHPYRDPCRSIVGDLARRRIAGEVSVEILREVLHSRRLRGPATSDAIARLREILAWELPVHEFGLEALQIALDLLAEHGELSTRDAVHAATALSHGIPTILSADRDFESIDGLDRVAPLDARAVAELRR